MITIPSYKRADNCATAKMLSRAVIFCHDFEKDEYKKYNNNKIEIIPDELQGKGMAIIRNYILDNTNDSEILMADDDINYIGHWENIVLHKMEENDIYRMIENNYRLCRECETILWGLNLQYDKKFYREYSPFSLSSVVLGPFLGIIKDEGIRFDERLGLKEDYDYSLQVLKKYRKILRFNKYHYNCGHIKIKGGCRGYRNKEKEKEQSILFSKKWGKKIAKINRRTQGGYLSINPTVNCPIKGI